MKTMRTRLSLTLAVFFLSLPILSKAADFEVKTIARSEGVPEEFCSIWREGDILISDGKFLALIGGVSRPLETFHQANARGSILSIVPAGKGAVSDLGIGAPLIRIKDKTHYPNYSSVDRVMKNVPQGVLRFLDKGSFEDDEGKKASIETSYSFIIQKGRVEITSTIRNTGGKAFEELAYSLYSTAFHSYSFSPFDREKYPRLNFRVYPKKGHYLAWINLNRLQDQPAPGKLSPGETYTVSYVLIADTQADRLLKAAYQTLKVSTFPVSIQFKEFDGKLMEVIVRDTTSGPIFFRSFFPRIPSIEIPLPQGNYQITANFFPAKAETYLSVGEKTANTATLACPVQETVKVRIIDKRGRYVPGKVAFIGISPSSSPYFMPSNPVESGNRWETFKNSAFPPPEGLELTVPAGKYLVYTSRGPEYTLDQRIIEVLKGNPLELEFTIDKVVDTRGLISLDPHMHTQNSDGTVTIPERIKSVVAEGVDVAVATDHNYISDYTPFLNELGLSEYLAVVYGSEVTRGGVIHFNTYPLHYRPEEENNGAINPMSETATPLIRASREKTPDAVFQVNHPRSGTLGYFNNLSLDPESAAWALPAFDTSFDLLEIMNGPYTFYRSNHEAIEDWLHLLNRGYYFPLVGSSDSHTIDGGEPGYSRTYILYDGEKGERLDLPGLIQSLKKGRTFATNGPVINFKVNGKYGPGDTFTSKTGKVKVVIEIQSAPWVEVSQVNLIVNGERSISVPVEKKKLRPMAAQTFTRKLRLNLEKDSYLIAEVSGKKSLYPVLQRSSSSGEFREAALPYALTNPVFVDVDGNQKFDPPLPEKIKLTTDITKKEEGANRY